MDKILARLKYLKCSDIKHVLFFILAYPSSFLFRIFHKDLWLICEDGDAARDNGYWFFKYLCENHKEINAVFSIKKKSPDRYKVLVLGKVISFGTFCHWLYYLSAKYIIFSAKLGKPSPAVCFPVEQMGLIRGKRIFLQHGIIKDDMKSLYYDVCKFSLFVTSVEREFNFIENTFGYKDKHIVKLLGVARFDNLINQSTSVKNNQILIMPTWRDWLGNVSLHTSKATFEKSEYFIRYQSLLNNSQFESFIREHNLQVIFFPHKGMQKFRMSFTTNSKNIIIADWNGYDIQNLLIESAICITDYSSIAMDFAFLEKPLLYYQFDYQEFRKGHYGEGYFSYKYDGFGEICTEEEQLISLLEEYFRINFKMKEIYLQRAKKFFTLRDNNNCLRIFEAIKELN